jgi:hypothetical protein
MHAFMCNISKRLCFTLFFSSSLCFAHNTPVHQAISAIAYQSSDGLQAFISENLETNANALLTAPLLPIHGGLTVSNWLTMGSKMEDEEKLLRCIDHFYTVLPQRIPGQVIGLTDNSEPIILGSILFPGNGTNSFAWGSQTGITGPSEFRRSIGANFYNWPSARAYEFAALTSSDQFARNTNMAMMFYALGHVVHLNQDTSVPDHVRNDAHLLTAYFEKYGSDNCSKNPQWFAPPTNHGWTFWHSRGFSQLLDFWDRRLYADNSSQGLIDDASGTKPESKLGLAEFSNGNFLGGTALYGECYHSGDIHYFQFPSLLSSTSYPTNKTIAGYLDSNLRTNFIPDGGLVKRIYLDKAGDGITLTNHSALNYLGVAYALRGSPPRLAKLVPNLNQVSVSIHDNNVLQAYHERLVPKAAEYSAGILDYFFRGTMDVTIPGYDTNSSTFTNIVWNTSGQDFHGGTFFVFADATNGTRTQIWQTNLSDVTTDPNGIFTNDTTFELMCPGPISFTNKYLLVYQGTIGWTNDAALDPVDSNICVAASQTMFKQVKSYYCYDETNVLGATIITNLESDDFGFVPGSYRAFVNFASFDDKGTIGSIASSGPITSCTYAGQIINTPVPVSDVTVTNTHLRVQVTATDDPTCGQHIGWWGALTITWHAWPVPE